MTRRAITAGDMITKAVARSQATATEVLSALTEAIGYTYDKDFLRPGVTLSWLGAESVYYASVVRYKADARGREVVCSARASNLSEVSRQLARAWYRQVTCAVPKHENPVEKLGGLLP